MKAETLPRPLSIGRVREGGVYSRPAAPLVQTNLFFRIGCLDGVFLKVPSARGLDDYRTFVKRAQSTCADVRPVEEVERFERLASILEHYPGLAPLGAARPEVAHYLLVHRLQYERLRAERTIGIPAAQFGVLLEGRVFRSLVPALFQAAVPGLTLWDMFDFDTLQVKPRWQPVLPAISLQLSRLLDSRLVPHIDWNIQNFVFHEPDRRLFYVDLKPTTFVARAGNERNLTGIRQHFVA